MAKFTRPSLYNKILIDNGTKTVDIKEATTTFSYYESLFSPHVTATLSYVDTGNSVRAENDQDTQERVGTVFSSLPLRGGEKVQVIIEPQNGGLTLDFDDYPLYVTGISIPRDEYSRQIVVLNLSSESAIKNENKTLYKKYYNNIGNTVSQILTQELEIPSSRLSIESTSNSYAFPGSARRPFDTILSLAPKSVPSSGIPGYFFWENRQYFNFKSIDTLIKANPIANYFYTNVVGNAESSNYRILNYTTTKNQNILSALRAGVYRTKNVFFDPFTFKYNEIYLKLSESGFEFLGDDPEYPDEFESSTAFTRTNYFVLDTGNMEVGLSTSINNDPRTYHAKSIMRYNVLFSQITNIVVPCNLSLKAGDNITVTFPKITSGNSSQGIYDESLSGKYLILHLSHQFTPDGQYGSTTHMTLIRDTYGGLYTSGGT